MNFKLINLGETIIPTSRYGIDLSHLVPVAVNFDLGGKTPLGRIDNDKPYDLIGTIDHMMKYVKDKDDKITRIDKNLSKIVSTVCYVYGDTNLERNYQKQIQKFLYEEKGNKKGLDGKFNCEIRALKYLKEGTVEIDYFSNGKSSTEAGELERFSPILEENGGALFNVKQEIYRIPDRLIYNLGLLCQIKKVGVWNIIDQLESSKIISNEAANNLKYAATFAVLLRLRSYLHNGSQKELMDIIPQDENSTSLHFRLTKQELQENGSLFKFYYTTLPFIETLKEFCTSTTNILQNLNNNKFYEQNPAPIYFRLLNYQAARIKYEDLDKKIKCEIESIKKQSPEKPTSNNRYFTLSKEYPSALKHYKENLLQYNKTLVSELIRKSKTSLELGYVYRNLTCYKESETAFQDGYDMANKACSISNSKINRELKIKNLYNLVKTSILLSDYTKVFQRIETLELLPLDTTTQEKVYNQLMISAFRDKKEDSEALKYFIKKLGITGFDKSEDITLYHMSFLGKLCYRNNSAQGKKLFEACISMFKGLKSTPDNTSLKAYILYSFAKCIIDNVYEGGKDQLTNAVKYLETALDMCTQRYTNKQQYIIVTSSQIGKIYRALRDICEDKKDRKSYEEKALKYYNWSLELLNQTYDNDSNIHYASIYMLNGELYAEQNTQIARLYFDQARKIDEKFFTKPHKFTACAYKRIAETYKMDADNSNTLRESYDHLKEAKETFFKVFEINSKLYGKDNTHTNKIRQELKHIAQQCYMISPDTAEQLKDTSIVNLIINHLEMAREINDYIDYSEYNNKVLSKLTACKKLKSSNKIKKYYLEYCACREHSENVKTDEQKINKNKDFDRQIDILIKIYVEKMSLEDIYGQLTEHERSNELGKILCTSPDITCSSQVVCLGDDGS